MITPTQRQHAIDNVKERLEVAFALAAMGVNYPLDLQTLAENCVNATLALTAPKERFTESNRLHYEQLSAALDRLGRAKARMDRDESIRSGQLLQPVREADPT